MKRSGLAIVALVFLGSAQLACADHYDTRSAACGEANGFRRTGPGRLFGCLPFCCLDDCDDVCDCDTPCCEYCGRKRKPPKEKKCLLSCLGCEDVPRGPVGMAIPARMNSLGESARERDEADQQAESFSEDGSLDEPSRMDKLEQDLTRLALVVEELARGQRQQQEDLSRAAIMLEDLSNRR